MCYFVSIKKITFILSHTAEFCQSAEKDHVINTRQIFSEEIDMELGISKCATLIIKWGIISRSEGIQLPNDKVIEDIEYKGGYIYAGILEVRYL